MSNMQGPNIAIDLKRIHRVITRGLEVSLENGRAYARDGYPDAPIKEGFVSYVQAFVSMTHGHHLTEDDLAFPYFQDKLPEMPFGALTDEHQEMVPILDEIQAAIEGVAQESEPGESLTAMNDALVRLADLWRPHIAKEEAGFDPDRVGALLSVDEQIKLAQQFAQHSAEHAGPDYLVVPFMLYNLSTEDRAAMSQAMPPIITQQLIPVVWKEKWAPMKPFLLD
jgi:hemerythrin-like domain-containing protein